MMIKLQMQKISRINFELFVLTELKEYLKLIFRIIDKYMIIIFIFFLQVLNIIRYL
jgi:hypothetical protein